MASLALKLSTFSISKRKFPIFRYSSKLKPNTMGRLLVLLWIGFLSFQSYLLANPGEHLSHPTAYGSEVDNNADLIQDKEHLVLDGQWQGVIEVQGDGGAWYTSKIDFAGRKFIDGCVLIDITEYEIGSTRSWEFKGHESYRDQENWREMQLDNPLAKKIGILRSTYGKSSPLVEGLDCMQSLIEANWMVIQNNSIQYEVFESRDQGHNWVLVAKAELFKIAH